MMIDLARDIDGYSFTDQLTVPESAFYDWLTMERLKPGSVAIMVDGKELPDGR